MAYDVPQYFVPEQYQACIEKMTDERLKEEGKGRSFLCSPACHSTVSRCNTSWTDWKRAARSGGDGTPRTKALRSIWHTDGRMCETGQIPSTRIATMIPVTKARSEVGE
jgi:hypothetical protein